MIAEETSLDELVPQAQAGEPTAIEAIVRRVQNDIYRLAIKMLWHPDDAQDATQEIVLRIITHLDSFRGESAFRTWIYRIATNVLLTTRKRCAERQTLSFAEFGQDLADGLSDALLPGESSAEQAFLVEEVKRGCTQGMLLCLDRNHRITYILGEILELTGEEGGQILGIAPATFRKRLSRARTSIRSFMQQHCGLINPDAGCRCARRVHRAIELGRVEPGQLRFATHPIEAEQARIVAQSVQEVEKLEELVAALHRQPAYRAPETVLQAVQAFLRVSTAQVFAQQ
jgi:RNA polymerase sigma factor (sigma-70 family)